MHFMFHIQVTWIIISLICISDVTFHCNILQVRQTGKGGEKMNFSCRYNLSYLRTLKYILEDVRTGEIQVFSFSANSN